MNDSFLEDLELVSNDVKTVNNYPVDRHVTTRGATSSPLQLPPSKGDSLQHKVEHSPLNEKHTVKEFNVKDIKKISEQDARKHQMKVRISEKREKSIDTKLKPIENKVKGDDREHEIRDDIKGKIRETRIRSSDSKIVAKDRSRRSGSCKENNQSSDLYVKENTKPPECSKESTSQVDLGKDKGKSSDYVKKLDTRESDSAALIAAIKDIVSMCTKQESTKILRSMQELHFSAQANLIKHLLSQTDEIIGEMHPSKDSSRIKNLVEQNEKLHEDIVILQKRNEELQKKLEEFEFLKQENIALKLKCKELSKH
ncbi:uncharacterized protein LOC143182879 [Calliopsis andreniformis]|uniref:uncharacterized protein LOC143182879 n=1 Tax=Calliopsis andreniformis TaxID=337506 RepID=UPI003FCD066B